MVAIGAKSIVETELTLCAPNLTRFRVVSQFKRLCVVAQRKYKIDRVER